MRCGGGDAVTDHKLNVDAMMAYVDQMRLKMSSDAVTSAIPAAVAGHGEVKSGADSLQNGTAALSPSVGPLSTNNKHPDDISCGDGGSKTALEGVVLISQRSPVFRVPPPHCSPDGAHAPRLLSAHVPYYSTESSSDEDFDDW